MIVARIFIVLAALLLVSAVAIAALTPLGMTLGQGLVSTSVATAEWLHAHSPDWAWERLAQPLLVRPLWLLPAALGVICAGVAASCSFGTASPSRRRRS